jgi:hypothetical protein
VTALTDVKDIVDPKLAKYSLMTQEPNTDGEMETHLFKVNYLDVSDTEFVPEIARVKY